MIQFNLLPDVKVNFIKAKKANRLVVSVAFLATVTSVVILLLMFSLQLAQKKHISDLNKDITKYTKQINGTQNLSKILTVQNQLKSLPSLYDERPAVDRLSSYIDQITPNQVNLTDLAMSFEGEKVSNSITLTGGSESLEAINKYVDTIKFTTYTFEGGSSTGAPAFSEVVLTAFTKSDTKSTFTINAKFDPVIFDATKKVTLTVPTTITTRSQINSPTSLFNGSTTTTTGK